MIREETQREKLRGMTAKRAWGMERRLEMRNGSRPTRDCWWEIKERALGIGKLSEWEEKRKNFYRKSEIIEDEKRENREERELEWQELAKKETELQKEETWKKINNSRYNIWYKWIKGEGVPSYLKKGWGESRWQRVAIFRLGYEMKEGRY